MKNLRAFTLIELMIVVAILGILTAIILPIVTGNTTVTNSFIQNGTICEPIQPGSTEGLVFSVSQGYRQQVIGTNGLPVGCTIQ